MYQVVTYSEAELNALASAVLDRIDPPRRNRDIPAKPAIIELAGMPKAGKDFYKVRLERWFKRRGWRILFHEEGAESPFIRKAPRDFSYAMQMRYLAQEFYRLVEAPVLRGINLVGFNRGFFEEIGFFEFERRRGKLSQEDFDIVVEFMLHGPWVQDMDAVIFLRIDPETALDREYGPAWREGKVRFGGLMNPETLPVLLDCFDTTANLLGSRMPNFPLFVVDTRESPDGVLRMLISIILGTLQRRLEVGEDTVFSHGVELMREKAWVAGSELKLRGIVNPEMLRRQGWQLETAVQEKDRYLTLKGREFLEDDVCWVLSRKGDRHYLICKKRTHHDLHRPKIPIPLPDSRVDELCREVFDEVAVIMKSREIFLRDGVVLHRDSVLGLGEFTEFKGPTRSTEEDLMALARELGFRDEDIVRESYIRLKLAAQK